MDNQDGLVLIGKGVTLKQFFENLPWEGPLPNIEYLVQDFEPGSELKSITCWKKCDCIFDISEDVVDLVKSWMIHKEWHKVHGEALLGSNQSYPDSFLMSYANPPLIMESDRVARMEKYSTN